MAGRQLGFWDVEHRLRQLSERGDPLEKLAATVDFKIFRAELGKLNALASEQEPQAEDLVPAVPIKKSVTEDYIVCLEDGKKLKMLKRHLMTSYGMTPADYRAKWGLPYDYPMVAPSYAAKRQELAKKIGLGRKRPEPPAPKPRGRRKAA